ncbi:hypothetical protein E2C01_050072 [Portunus trituberculatus]|uniref:Uncharacterized protein n=1 Tax=Portunus trituberculatus TaxID=210409 RepID=A0A5B7G7A6_PORTR|nr:hypothetical protein [Portunus trituberculatus]
MRFACILSSKQHIIKTFNKYSALHAFLSFGAQIAVIHQNNPFLTYFSSLDE